jgi:hypothetical protein
VGDAAQVDHAVEGAGDAQLAAGALLVLAIDDLIGLVGVPDVVQVAVQLPGVEVLRDGDELRFGGEHVLQWDFFAEADDAAGVRGVDLPVGEGGGGGRQLAQPAGEADVGRRLAVARTGLHAQPRGGARATVRGVRGAGVKFGEDPRAGRVDLARGLLELDQRVRELAVDEVARVGAEKVVEHRQHPRHPASPPAVRLPPT